MSQNIVFSFGRINPPTRGHEKLFKAVVKVAKENLADHIVYLSQSNNAKTDPLQWPTKIRLCKAAFPDLSISEDESIKTPFQALESLAKTYSKIFFVVGEDQFIEFSKRMPEYAQRWGVDLTIVSAGKRTDSTRSIEGISASKMRELAKNDKKEQFFKWLPKNLSVGLKTLAYNKTKEGLSKPTKCAVATKSHK